MGRMAVSVGPGFFASNHLVWIRQSLLCDEALERREPVFVIARAVVRLAAIHRGFEFVGERSRPLLPREMALCGKPDGEREGLSLPGLGKDGTALVAGKQGQRSRVARDHNRPSDRVNLAASLLCHFLGERQIVLHRWLGGAPRNRPLAFLSSRSRISLRCYRCSLVPVQANSRPRRRGPPRRLRLFISWRPQSTMSTQRSDREG